MTPEQLLALVDDEQRAAVTADPGPLLVVAGAGTGKTRTLTCRIAYRAATGDTDPGVVLAVTHSTRAAAQLRERLVGLGVPRLGRVAAFTIHAAALRQLRFFWGRAGWAGEPVVCEDRFGVARAALARAGLPRPEPALVADVLTEIEWAKSQLLDPAAYPDAAAGSGRSLALPPQRIAVALEGYTQALAERGELDYTDLLTRTADLLERYPDVAAEVHNRYQSLYVDEYQDVDPAQQRLLTAWAGPGRDITAVGDPRQSIYAFKGADPTRTATFASVFPGARVVTLTRNYRSTPQVVAAANTLAEHITGKRPPRPRGKTARAVWEATYPAPLTATRPHGVSVAVQELGSTDAETSWVARQVAAALRSGTPAGEIAVLYRYNAQSAGLEQALTDAGVPYQVADGGRFFNRPEITAVLNEMVHRVQRAPMRGPGPYEDEDDGGGVELLSGPSLLREVLADAGFDRERPPAGLGALRDRWEAWSTLLALVEGLPGAELLSPQGLLDELWARATSSQDQPEERVTLATIHKAKGLEWDTVFLPSWTEGVLPLSAARSETAQAEERRLAYVAMTRARKRLVLSYARVRPAPQPGQVWTLRPSRFLAEAGFTLADGATITRRDRAARGARAGGAQVARCGRCQVPLEGPAERLGACPVHLRGEPARVFSTLRDWRTAQARVESVPPYRVLTDATILELVASRPATVEELARVPGIGPAKLERYGSDLARLTAP